MSRKKEYSVRRGREAQANSQLVAQQMPRQIDPMAFLAYTQRQKENERQYQLQGAGQQIEQQRLGLSQQQLAQQGQSLQQRLLESQHGMNQADRSYGLQQDQFNFTQQNAQQQQAMALMQFLATMALNREKMQAEAPLTAAQIANYQANARRSGNEADMFDMVKRGAQQQPTNKKPNPLMQNKDELYK